MYLQLYKYTPTLLFVVGIGYECRLSSPHSINVARGQLLGTVFCQLVRKMKDQLSSCYLVIVIHQQSHHFLVCCSYVCVCCGLEIVSKFQDLRGHFSWSVVVANGLRGTPYKYNVQGSYQVTCTVYRMHSRNVLNSGFGMQVRSMEFCYMYSIRATTCTYVVTKIHVRMYTVGVLQQVIEDWIFHCLGWAPHWFMGCLIIWPNSCFVVYTGFPTQISISWEHGECQVREVIFQQQLFLQSTGRCDESSFKCCC